MREKTSTSRSKQKSLVTEDEIIVAEILVDLPRVIRSLESRYSFQWGNKKRRSRFDESARTRPKAAAMEVSARASPVTPLAFSPSESDGKSTRANKKNSTKTSREEYCAIIEELSERRDFLRQEIGNVTKYYSNLLAYNSELKEALNRCRRNEMEKSDVGGGRAEGFGIPDLNICVEEAFGVDVCRPLDLRLRRAAFAEARRRRMDIMKIKSIKLGRPCWRAKDDRLHAEKLLENG